MSTYQKKIARGVQMVENALSELDMSSENWINNEVWRAREGIRLIENPFQTTPKTGYIQITTSFCDPDGSSTKAHDDHINIDLRSNEITAALLYSILKSHVDTYDEITALQVSIQDLEDWLNQQKPFYKTTIPDEPFIQDTGLTVSDNKTDYGSIDVFIEYALEHEEETWIPTTE